MIAPVRRRFARLVAATALIALLAVAVFNRLADPYGLYDGPRWAGFNALKARPDLNLGDIKLAGALRARPDALILGNSRADIGFDPHTLASLGWGERPFNLAVPGSGIETNLQHLQTLLAAGIEPRRLLIGVEFIDYLQRHGAAPAKPAALPVPWERRLLKLRLQELFTFTALKDSLATVAAQGRDDTPVLRDDGFNPLRDYAAQARRDGYFAFFRQRGIENARRFRTSEAPARWEETPDYQALDRLLGIARARGISVDLVIYPYHAQILGLYRHYGLLAPFESWKASLAALRVRHAEAGTSVRLWDWSIPDERSSEPIPAAGDRRTATRWYWEAGHFKSALGDELLRRMRTADRPEPLPAAGRFAPVSLSTSVATLFASRPDLARDIAEITVPLQGKTP